MKNIYILPSIKPTRLTKALHYNNCLRFVHKDYECSPKDEIFQHVYITSDEELKEGDSFLVQHNVEGHILSDRMILSKANGNFMMNHYIKEVKDVWFKVILTTDPRLIKDGVQEIQLDFLVWLVKNPNTEEIRIENNRYLDIDSKKLVDDYVIIIPTEKVVAETKKTYKVELSEEEMVKALVCLPNLKISEVDKCVWCGGIGSDVKTRRMHGHETSKMCYPCFHRECVIDD